MCDRGDDSEKRASPTHSPSDVTNNGDENSFTSLQSQSSTTRGHFNSHNIDASYRTLPSSNFIQRPSRLTLDPSYTPQPVSPSHVQQEAAPIFMHFVSQRVLVDQLNESITPTSSMCEQRSSMRPPLVSPTISNLSFNSLTREQLQVAHRLVELGDIIDEEHGADFNYIFQFLGANIDNVSYHFYGIAGRLFQKDTEPSWSQLLVLVYFGYRLGIMCLRHGVQGFLRDLGQTFADIISRFNLSSWIGSQGGWRSILYLVHEYIATLPSLVTGVISVVAIMAFTWSLSRTLR